MSASILACHGLGFRYPSAPQPVLRGFDLKVSASEVVAVTGPSGCGKSTLLYVLGLFLHADAGTLRILGVETTAMGDRQRSLLRAHVIGFVLQEAAFHQGLSLRQNVADGALYSGSSATEARDRADVLLYRYGLTNFAAQRPSEVSGGQAQRAALCRALIRRPALILADEPTGNLDEENAQLVMAGLRDAAHEGAGVLVVTHSSAIAAATDRVIAL